MDSEHELIPIEQSPLPAVVEPSQTQPLTRVATPQELRAEQVDALLRPAYERAATLQLTDAERAALTAPFPDSAVECREHDGLYYLPHILISDRLTEVFGPGAWTTVRRWERIERNVIYAEWVLLIRGCYIGESVGGHLYVAANPKTNYADALEATRGEALRRICAKYLSCGSQVWSPAYCRALDNARREQQKPRAVQAQKTQSQPPAKTEATKEHPHIARYRRLRAEQLARFPAGHFPSDKIAHEWFSGAWRAAMRARNLPTSLVALPAQQWSEAQAALIALVDNELEQIRVADKERTDAEIVEWLREATETALSGPEPREDTNE